MSEKLTPERLSSAAVEQIKRYITDNRLPAGTRLPGERQLCERFGVSRSSLREALRVLEVVGLVETRPRSGIYVRAPETNVLQAPLWPWLVTHKETAQQMYELRELIEPGAAALAAARAEAADLAALAQALAEMEACMQQQNLAGMILADSWFHHIITRASRNTYLISLMDNIVQVLEEVRKAALSVPGLSERALAGHRQIYEAIAQGDSAAATATMAQHLCDAWLYIDRKLEAAAESGL